MSKTKTEVEVKTNSTSLVPYDYGQHAGAGFENTSQADVSVPFFNVLQALSPEVQEGSEKFITGARPGMIIDNVTKTLYDGKKGINIVPVDTQHVFAEWISRAAGGGFVALHEIDSDIVKQVTGGKPARGKLKMTHDAAVAADPEKLKLVNDLIETFYVFAMVLNEEGTDAIGLGVFSFTGAKIKRYKAFMSDVRKFSGKTPLYAHRLRITTVPDKNRQGQSFFNIEGKPLMGDIGKSLIPPVVDGSPNPLLEDGARALQAFRGGEAKVRHEAGAETSTQGDPTDEVF